MADQDPVAAVASQAVREPRHQHEGGDSRVDGECCAQTAGSTANIITGHVPTMRIHILVAEIRRIVNEGDHPYLLNRKLDSLDLLIRESNR